ncbi:hypothetical protein G7059_10130 [Erysipelothrix sp. HDW6A]|uniref:hypothetical protein n=1 Tax=Erysipelothrix sp. HDW6A TaxID=2714928 RepID=UPI00140C0533|nr:hypothetical protein [Erysipelothrix sp. HDW6A]QIK58176.1 hypothetical protein G7059_10130 [Erysipelothrix sp. HDW6A]
MKNRKYLIALTAVFTGMVVMLLALNPINAASDDYGVGSRKGRTTDEESWYCDRLEREVSREEVEERRAANHEECPRYNENVQSGTMKGHHQGHGNQQERHHHRNNVQ